MLRKQNKKWGTDGFTVIELLIVIAIIGVLLAIIFVALDPSARFGQARDAVREHDTQTIVTAIKNYQADNGGENIEGIAGLRIDQVYMITGGAMNSGCTDNNPNCATEVTGPENCVDVSELVTLDYLDQVPVAPSAFVVWDKGETDGSEGTGYTIEKSAEDLITIRACESEQTGAEIKAAR